MVRGPVGSLGKEAEAMAIKVGMMVEFESNYGPGTEFRTMRGVVIHVGTPMFPSNVVVMAPCGNIELLKSSLRTVAVPIAEILKGVKS